MKSKTVNLSDIKFDDDVFSLTPSLTTTAPQKLSKSISRVGILHPPIIVEIADGIYRIGSGRRRLLAAAELNVQQCYCNIFKSTDHPIDIFNYIYEEASHTNLPIISKAIFLKKTGQWLKADELAKKFMQGFGLKANSFHVKKLQQLASLEINIQEALITGNIDEKVCHELVKLDFIDRMGLFDIISKLSLSVGNQRKLLISSREISIRSQMTMASFLGQKILTTILTDQSLNTPQKTTLYMKQLEELRFPLLSEAKEEFRSFIKTLPLQNSMSISHAPSFEKDELSLTIKCDSRDEIIDLINTIISNKS